MKIQSLYLINTGALKEKLQAAYVSEKDISRFRTTEILVEGIINKTNDYINNLSEQVQANIKEYDNEQISDDTFLNDNTYPAAEKNELASTLAWVRSQVSDSPPALEIIKQCEIAADEARSIMVHNITNTFTNKKIKDGYEKIGSLIKKLSHTEELFETRLIDCLVGKNKNPDQLSALLSDYESSHAEMALIIKELIDVGLNPEASKGLIDLREKILDKANEFKICTSFPVENFVTAFLKYSEKRLLEYAKQSALKEEDFVKVSAWGYRYLAAIQNKLESPKPGIQALNTILAKGSYKANDDDLTILLGHFYNNSNDIDFDNTYNSDEALECYKKCQEIYEKKLEDEQQVDNIVSAEVKTSSENQSIQQEASNAKNETIVQVISENTSPAKNNENDNKKDDKDITWLLASSKAYASRLQFKEAEEFLIAAKLKNKDDKRMEEVEAVIAEYAFKYLNLPLESILTAVNISLPSEKYKEAAAAKQIMQILNINVMGTTILEYLVSQGVDKYFQQAFKNYSALNYQRFLTETNKKSYISNATNLSLTMLFPLFSSLTGLIELQYPLFSNYPLLELVASGLHIANDVRAIANHGANFSLGWEKFKNYSASEILDWMKNNKLDTMYNFMRSPISFIRIGSSLFPLIQSATDKIYYWKYGTHRLYGKFDYLTDALLTSRVSKSLMVLQLLTDNWDFIAAVYFHLTKDTELSKQIPSAKTTMNVALGITLGMALYNFYISYNEAKNLHLIYDARILLENKEFDYAERRLELALKEIPLTGNEKYYAEIYELFAQIELMREMPNIENVFEHTKSAIFYYEEVLSKYKGIAQSSIAYYQKKIILLKFQNYKILPLVKIENRQQLLMQANQDLMKILEIFYLNKNKEQFAEFCEIWADIILEIESHNLENLNIACSYIQIAIEDFWTLLHQSFSQGKIYFANKICSLMLKSSEILILTAKLDEKISGKKLQSAQKNLKQLLEYIPYLKAFFREIIHTTNTISAQVYELMAEISLAEKPQKLTDAYQYLEQSIEKYSNSLTESSDFYNRNELNKKIIYLKSKYKQIKEYAESLELKPRWTIPDGNCAIHAVFGEWSPRAKHFVCKAEEVVKYRNQLADVIRKCQPGDVIFPLVQEAIRDIILDTKYVGKNLSTEQKKFRHFQIVNSLFLEIEMAWNIFEKELRKYPEVIAKVENFAKAYSERKNVSLPTLKLKFTTFRNEDETNALALLQSISDLSRAHKEYNESCGQSYQWEDILSNRDNINEYADFIAKPGKWLLPLELHILAIICNIKIDYYSRDRAHPTKIPKNIDVYNPHGTKVVSVCFDGKDHFERMANDEQLCQYEIAEGYQVTLHAMLRQKMKIKVTSQNVMHEVQEQKDKNREQPKMS